MLLTMNYHVQEYYGCHYWLIGIRCPVCRSRIPINSFENHMMKCLEPKLSYNGEFVCAYACMYVLQHSQVARVSAW